VTNPIRAPLPALLPATLAALLLASCGGSPPPPVAEAPPATPPAEQAPAPADDAAAQLAAKEAELSQREAELALKEKEQELAQREAALKAQQAAAKKTTSGAKATTAAAVPAPAPAKAEPAPAAKPVVVPAGTSITAELVTPVSSKTNRRGDRIEARVLSDVMVDGQRAVPAGTILSGTLTDRVSGSKEIGATPMIGVTFDTLATDADHAVGVSAKLVQTGKSEGLQDTAKIAGGAVAGAIIGKQVSDDKGKIIGGVLGAAAGAAAAKNTGTEVELPAGTVISVTLDYSVEMKP
jgi:hypothetical protein